MTQLHALIPAVDRIVTAGEHHMLTATTRTVDACMVILFVALAGCLAWICTPRAERVRRAWNR